MKKFFYCLGGMLVFFCLLGSCSMGGEKPKDLLESEETTKKEKEKEAASEDEKVSEDETLNEEEENPDKAQDEAQDDPEDIPPPAVFVICKTLPENEIVFEFSGSVSLVSLNFDLDLGYEVIEEGSKLKIKLTKDPDPGLSVKADLQVKDEYDNTVSEHITFRTRNNNVPNLQINELRTLYKNLQAEYIEFKMLSDGNLGALRVFAVSNDTAPLIYIFEPVAVKEGEYVVLHLRKLEESCRDEYGDSLDESGGTDSNPKARDFWIHGSNKLLRDTDAVYVLDQDDKVLDAVMFAVNANSWLNKNYFSETSRLLFDQGAWKSATGTVCSAADVVNSSGIGTAMTRSISRDETAENTHSAIDWYITANSGVTPGQKNNPKRL